jgi:hypothetical protein
MTALDAYGPLTDAQAIEVIRFARALGELRRNTPIDVSP